MALLSFPPNPTNGEIYPSVPIVGQSQYQYDAATQTWTLLGTVVGVTPGCYGDASNVPTFCVDAQGRVISAANVPVAFPTTLTFVAAPTTSGDAGTSGQVAVDGVYLYVYTGSQWQRIAWDTTPW